MSNRNIDRSRLVFIKIGRPRLIVSSLSLVFEVYSLRVDIKNVSEKKLYSPSLVLRLKNSDTPYLIPEWRNFKYIEGWSREDNGNPPNPNWRLFYYDLEDLVPDWLVSRDVRLLVRRLGKFDKYTVWFTVGAYEDRKCTPDTWLNMSWVEWNFDPSYATLA
ncbi:MAG: hypothetical protein QXL25_01370 [Candidatus Bathyarchaeia archaeon]